MQSMQQGVQKRSYTNSSSSFSFYPGRTIYGGASSYYYHNMKPPVVKKKRIDNNLSSVNPNISSSARRIMDMLETYSSPLNEAKRLPQINLPKSNNCE